MSREPMDAVIVGAGVVGAALALGLHRRGLRVAVVEAHEPAAWQREARDLRVYAVAPDSRALLDALGVWTGVRERRAQAYGAMHVWDAGGGPALQFDAARLGVPCLGHIIEHGLLVDRLWAALREAGVACHTGAKLAALEQDDAQVSAVLSDERRCTARWLFGADGAQSAVRARLGITLDTHDYAQRGLVAYVRSTQPHADTCWQRFLPTGPLALLPCTDQRLSIVWSLPEAEAVRLLAAPEAQFNAELTRASDRMLGDLALDSERVSFPLKRQLAARMSEGRVALLGDAAHAVHPLAGQGVNLGLRDVAALLAALDAASAKGRSGLSESLLERWARARFSENTLAARSFEAINAVYSNDAPLPLMLRGAALGVANFPPLNRLLWGHAAGA